LVIEILTIIAALYLAWYFSDRYIGTRKHFNEIHGMGFEKLTSTSKVNQYLWSRLVKELGDRYFDSKNGVNNTKADVVLSVLKLADKFMTRKMECMERQNEIELIKSVPLATQLQALNTLIDMEFNLHVVLPRSGMEHKPPIDDVRAVSEHVAKKVFGNLNDRFFEIFRIYGLSEDYIMSYTIRELFSKIILFSKERNTPPEP